MRPPLLDSPETTVLAATEQPERPSNVKFSLRHRPINEGHQNLTGVPTQATQIAS